MANRPKCADPEREQFRLWNTDHGEYVAYCKRKYGINLGWFDRRRRPKANFSIKRDSRRTAPLQYDEPFALREQTGDYVRYKKRSNGINLVWSSTPVYEWTFSGPGRRGQAVEPRKLGDSPTYISDTLVSLYNQTARKHVVYGKRNRGINLVWK